MTTGRWNSRNRITKETREQILYAYLGDPIKGTELAMSNGLTAAYAYKLAYERGLLPRRDEKLLGRSHSVRLASTSLSSLQKQRQCLEAGRALGYENESFTRFIAGC